MTDVQQRNAARSFAEFWNGKGYEKGEGQQFWTSLLRDVYGIALLFCGGILGMSLINSIMVDAMVEDNNDDVKEQLRRLEEKIDKLSK